jgi:hypothetical protein
MIEDDLVMFRLVTEPGLIGLDWAGFRDAQAPVRRFATDGYRQREDLHFVFVGRQVAGAAATLEPALARAGHAG